MVEIRTINDDQLIVYPPSISFYYKFGHVIYALFVVYYELFLSIFFSFVGAEILKLFTSYWLASSVHTINPASYTYMP